MCVYGFNNPVTPFVTLKLSVQKKSFCILEEQSETLHDSHDQNDTFVEITFPETLMLPVLCERLFNSMYFSRLLFYTFAFYIVIKVQKAATKVGKTS